MIEEADQKKKAANSTNLNEKSQNSNQTANMTANSSNEAAGAKQAKAEAQTLATDHKAADATK